MSTGAGIGDMVVSKAMMEYGWAGVVTYPGSIRAHLVIRGKERMECGAPLDMTKATLTRNWWLPKGKTWCYSCIGNAAEALDR